MTPQENLNLTDGRDNIINNLFGSNNAVKISKNGKNGKDASKK
jgi:hypothetical protein